MIKKISAILIALTMSAMTFASCSLKKDSSSSETESTVDISSADEDIDEETEEETTVEPSFIVDGKKIDTENYVMCAIDGEDIDFDMFRYYYYYTLSTYTSTYGMTLDDIQTTENGFRMFMEDVVTSIKQEMVAKKLAKENGIELDEEDMKTIDEQIETAKSNYESTEAYLDDLKAAYLTEDLYREMLELAQLYTKVNDTLFTNEGKYATKKDEFREIVKDTSIYCREVHVMIPYFSQVELDDSTAESYDSLSLSEKASAKQSAYSNLDDEQVEEAKEKANQVAEEVLKKAKDGEDFNKLIEEYGWDIGLEDPTNGYYFNKDTTGFPESIVTSAFALEENEISSEVITDSTYGYFIIKRLPVELDYVNQNIDDMIYSYDTPALSKLYQETMDAMTVTYCDNWDKIAADSIT